jgi:hypothetical protein
MPDLTLKLELSATAIDSALSSYATRVSTVSIGSTQNAAVFTADSGSGADVWFSSNRSGTTAIDAKLVYWSDGDSEFAFDVEIASVSASTGATIYLQVGDKPVGYGTNPYDASTKFLLPMMADFNDDTSNGNNGTGNGSISAGGVTGPDGALPATAFNGSTQYVSLSDIDVTNYTLHAWAKCDGSAYREGILTKDQADTGNFIALMTGSSDNLFGGHKTSGTQYTSVQGTALPAAWKHCAVTYDGSDVRLFVDGSQVDTDAATTNPPNNSDIWWIGRADLGGSFGTYFKGDIAGVGLISTARSAAWIKADYLLQGSSSASYWTDTDVTAVASYYVYNAGTAAVNQWYDLDSFDGNGRPIYLGRTDSDYVLQYSVDQDTFQGAWALEHTSGQYYYFISAAMDPVEDTYTAYLGSAPGAIVGTAVPAATGNPHYYYMQQQLVAG